MLIQRFVQVNSYSNHVQGNPIFVGSVPIDCIRVGIDPIPDWLMILVTNNLVTIESYKPSSNDPFEQQQINMVVHFTNSMDATVPYGFLIGRITKETCPECFIAAFKTLEQGKRMHHTYKGKACPVNINDVSLIYTESPSIITIGDSSDQLPPNGRGYSRARIDFVFKKDLD